MRIGIIYDRLGDREPPPNAPPDWDAEFEPEMTIAAIEDALRALGHTPVRVGDARALLRRMGAGPLDFAAAVNIAEGYGSRNREAQAPVLLELADVPCLGSDAHALSVSLDKHLTKLLAHAAGVPTPEWGRAVWGSGLPPNRPPLPVFVKPRYEGTAKGIAPTSRCDRHEAFLREVHRQLRLYRQDLIVEQFVPGAEFTVAVVGGGTPADPAEALPVLQRATERKTGIGLHALERHEPPGRPFEHDLTGDLTSELEAELQRLALRVFRLLGCRDFARVDFRVGRDGRPWFLEINPLPTFAPGDTFAIVAALMGRTYTDFLAGVLGRGLHRLGVNREPVERPPLRAKSGQFSGPAGGA